MADIGWRTINGTHVYLSGKGTIMKGPASLVGQKASDIQGQGGKLLYLQSSISEMSAKADYQKTLKKTKEEAKYVSRKRAVFEEAQKAVNNGTVSIATKTQKTTTKNVSKEVQPKNATSTAVHNGYNIPTEFFNKNGQLSTAGKSYYNDLVRKDPTKALQTSGIKTAFAQDFKKAGITDSYVIGDACSFMQQGHSFNEAVKLALELEAKFK